MNSSTFSFKHELLVIAVVLAGLAASELAVRAAVMRYGFKVSSNLSKLAQLPTNSARWYRSSDRPRMLLVGNSVAVEGLGDDTPGNSLDPLRDQLSAQAGCEVPLQALVFHEMRAREWYWMVEQRFAQQNRMPELMVICLDSRFARDAGRVKVRLLARFFPWNTRPLIPAVDVPEFGDRVEFVIARYSQCFSIAHNIGDAMLERAFSQAEAIRPLREANNAGGSFRRGVVWAKEMRTFAQQQSSQATDAATETTAGEADPREKNYSRLIALLELAQQHQTHVVCYFMPHRQAYDIPAELSEVIHDHQGVLIDGRTESGLTPADYADDIHLNHDGRLIFTPTFVHRILPELREAVKPR